jgi:hypothetical protein
MKFMFDMVRCKGHGPVLNFRTEQGNDARVIRIAAFYFFTKR